MDSVTFSGRAISTLFRFHFQTDVQDYHNVVTGNSRFEREDIGGGIAIGKTIDGQALKEQASQALCVRWHERGVMYYRGSILLGSTNRQVLEQKRPP